MGCRRTARAEDVAELASVGEQIAGNGADWDEEALDAEEEGLVFFDGMHTQQLCLAARPAPQCVLTSCVKCVSNGLCCVFMLCCHTY